jgi:hypothetical protein
MQVLQFLITFHSLVSSKLCGYYTFNLMGKFFFHTWQLLVLGISHKLSYQFGIGIRSKVDFCFILMLTLSMYISRSTLGPILNWIWYKLGIASSHARKNILNWYVLPQQ